MFQELSDSDLTNNTRESEEKTTNSKW
jgi:hypothetical protein